MNEQTISEAAKQAAALFHDEQSYARRERIIQDAITAATAERDQRIAELQDSWNEEHKITRALRNQVAELTGERDKHVERSKAWCEIYDTLRQAVPAQFGLVGTTGIGSALSAVSTLRETIADLQKFINNLKTHLSESKQAIADLQSRVTVAERRAVDRQGQITDLVKRLNDRTLRTAYEATQKLEASEARNAELRRERNDWKICAGEYEKSRDSALTQLEEARGEAGRLDTMLNGARSAIFESIGPIGILLKNEYGTSECDDDEEWWPELRSHGLAARHASTPSGGESTKESK